MTRVAWCSVMAPLGLVAAYTLACGDTSHVFAGRLFVQQRECLGTESSVDVVSGEPSEQRCAAVCLAQPLAAGGRAIYVSTTCPPYPFLFDASGGDPLCPTALAALGRNDTCLTDGGSTAALEPVDAGHD